eukprot:g1182.t1
MDPKYATLKRGAALVARVVSALQEVESSSLNCEWQTEKHAENCAFKKFEDAGDAYMRRYVEFYWRRLTGERADVVCLRDLLPKVRFEEVEPNQGASSSSSAHPHDEWECEQGNLPVAYGLLASSSAASGGADHSDARVLLSFRFVPDEEADNHDRDSRTAGSNERRVNGLAGELYSLEGSAEKGEAGPTSHHITSDSARVKFAENVGHWVAELAQWMLPISYVGVKLFRDRFREEEDRGPEGKKDPESPSLDEVPKQKEDVRLPVTFASRAERRQVEKKYCNVVEALVGALSIDDESEDEIESESVATPPDVDGEALTRQTKVKLLKRLCALAISVLALDPFVTGRMEKGPPGEGFTSIEKIWESRARSHCPVLVGCLRTLRTCHRALVREILGEVCEVCAELGRGSGIHGVGKMPALERVAALYGVQERVVDAGRSEWYNRRTEDAGPCSGSARNSPIGGSGHAS